MSSLPTVPMTEHTPMPSILVTKISSPRLRADAIARKALMAQVESQAQASVWIVAAPAGFGKTTFLAQWAAQASCPVAWLSLGQEDSELLSFLTHLVASLHQAWPAGRQQLQPWLNLPPQVTFQVLLTALLNELAALPHELALILDDYHLVTTPTVHDAVAFLLTHAPPQLRLMISSRTQPPLPLAMLRARGQLLEVTMTDLRFAPTETATFFRETMHLALSEETTTFLHNATEGWVTGLQLAAMALRSQAASTAAGLDFSGAQRYVFDYLAVEVLRQQPDAVQAFLLQTAVLDQLTAPLCDAVTHQTNSQAMLAHLEQQHLFTVALDQTRTWYRYHQLLRDFLRTKAERAEPALFLRSHRRAAAWYATQGLLKEAIEHGLAAQDYGGVARQISALGDRLWSHQEMAALAHWLARLPALVLYDEPKLLLLHAWSQLILEQLDQVEMLLQAAESCLLHQSPKDDGLWGIYCTIRGSLAEKWLDPQALQWQWQALAQLPRHLVSWRSAAYLGLGFAQRRSGVEAAATTTFARASDLCLQAGNVYGAVFARFQQGQSVARQGQLAAATALYQAAIALASRDQIAPLPIVAWPQWGLAEILYEQNELAAATEQLLQAVHWSKQTSNQPMVAQTYLTLVRVALAAGDVDQAVCLMEEAQTLVDRGATVVRALCHLTQARLWLVQRQGARLQSWLAHLAQPPSPLDLPAFHLMRARILLAQGDGQAAHHHLVNFLAAPTPLPVALQFEAQALHALAHQAIGAPADALEQLTPLLSRTQAAGYCRLLVDEGPSMQILLAYLVTQQPQNSYAQRLLACFGPSHQRPGQPVAQALIESLSVAECEILRLLAQGYTNQQIAAQRVTAITTVKWHLKNIYGKLGVRNRTAAVTRAQALALL